MKKALQAKRRPAGAEDAPATPRSPLQATASRGISATNSGEGIVLVL